MRKAKWTITLTLALVFAMSAAAMAQVPVVAQVPLAPNTIPQYAPTQTLPTLFNGIDVALGNNIVLSMCEFKTNILPAGTPVAGVGTHVWGYIVGDTCPGEGTTGQDTLITNSYLGPVIAATRNAPTAVTIINKLGNAASTKVLAYQQSTDQTLIWADPFGSGPNPYPPPPLVPAEFNSCYHSIVPNTAPLAPCNLNYDGSIPAAVHLHGGEVPPMLDGGPDAWWTGNGSIGHGYYTRTVYKQLPAFLAALPDALNYPVGALVEVAGVVYENKADAWVATSAVPFGAGQMVYLDYQDPPSPPAPEPPRPNEYHLVVADLAAPAGKKFEQKAVPDRATYVYPNVQDASPIWFHDHVLGATRLNVYAGVAGGYMVTDNILANTGTLAPGLLPLGLDRNANNTLDLGTDEILVPIIIQDRMFDANGELFFPAVLLNPEHPFWVPEFVGDTIAVNGKVWPTLTVDRKRYRFLFLNGSNARAYELYLFDKVAGFKGPGMWVIGNDQGYLNNPKLIDPKAKKGQQKLIIMPGERYEVVIDFSLAPATTTQLELINTARTPYPGGAPAAGRTTGKIMQFVLNPGVVTDTSYNPAAVGQIVRTTPMTALTTATVTRQLTLNEVIGPGGPVEILMNNTKYHGESDRTNAPASYNDFTPIKTRWDTTLYSELPAEGVTEIWEIVNITADAHPIHPHLVAFQILNREPIDFKAYDAAYNAAFPGGSIDPLTGVAYPPNVYMPGFGPPCNYNSSCGSTRAVGGNPDVTPFLLGAAMPPLASESGWKDTAISYPGEVLRMIIRFAPTDPAKVHYEFSPDGGHGYVWHCHIIDHEDNEMMRPFSVTVDPATTRTFVMGRDF